MRRVYISSPIRGKAINVVEKSFQDGESYILHLKDTPISPYKLSKQVPFPDHLSWGTTLKLDLQLLDMADAILMMPGWSLSNGCKVEYFYAKGTNKTILFYPLKT